MENNDDGRRAVSAETFYGTHESENNMVMSEKVINFVRIFSQLLTFVAIWFNISVTLIVIVSTNSLSKMYN